MYYDRKCEETPIRQSLLDVVLRDGRDITLKKYKPFEMILPGSIPRKVRLSCHFLSYSLITEYSKSAGTCSVIDRRFSDHQTCGVWRALICRTPTGLWVLAGHSNPGSTFTVSKRFWPRISSSPASHTHPNKFRLCTLALCNIDICAC
jgi:hypothetical protein